MDPQNAIRLLDDTFNRGFDEGHFLNFIRELFNGFDAKPKKLLVNDTFNEYIDPDNYRYFGEYRDSSGKLIDVLAIKLRKNTSRDRARTMQRNFVAKHLSKNNKHAALVAFYGYDPEDWRFSFVKLDYHREKDDSGKVKTVEELTPAKRYSFLVGINEPNHTCRSQFLGLIKEENINPSFEEIETAFSIEKVTKEFFEKYKGLFLELKDALDGAIEKDPYIKEDFDDKDLSTVDFAKKLLGQIVFLYFLQKKGWLGVEKDKNTRKFKEWGSGPKNFLKKLFDKEIVQYDNFFNDVLEPLFYEALAREHDGDYYSRFECKIPFLNGGLFEPISDYNWQETDILLDNAIFENIIGTFNEFNFTVKEDEPLEKEVAVDPEMLGKVFENLLEVKDRKSKGAFYTPREIVHYMCQQSLINYLETNTMDKGIPREDLETFIQFGDYSSSADQRYLIEINKLLRDIRSGRSKNVVRSQEQIQKLISKLMLPNLIISNKELIDRLLADIKVVDPAVGSGAFPVGMMNEIVKARSILTIFWPDDAKSDERTSYNIKRQTIQNCLYGVDLDSSAVDITKLRFWLSLIVDEDDMEHIQPLPNLDNKIMCGNSLLEEFEGVKLFDENMLGEPVIDHSFEIEQIDSKIDGLNEKLHKIYTGMTADDGDPKPIKKQISRFENEKKKLLSAPKEKTQQLNLSDADNFRIKQSQRKLRGLRALQKQFFDAQSKKEKTKLRNDIDNLEWELTEETLKEDGNEESIQKLQQYKKAKSKPFFLWKLYFAEVFQRENPGFDVVIANPPYVQIQKFSGKQEQKDWENENYKTYNKTGDIYCLFYEKGNVLLRDFGVLTFITSNKWMRANYGKLLRQYFINYTNPTILVDFGGYKVFDTATVDTCILISEKEPYSKNTVACAVKNDFNLNSSIDNYMRNNSIILDDLSEESWIISNKDENKIKKKIEQIGIPLGDWDISIYRGVLTGFNEAFVISGKKKDELIAQNPKSAEIIKPILRGRDIKRYKTEFADKWLIATFPALDLTIDDYPAVKNYLKSFEQKLEQTGESYIDKFGDEIRCRKKTANKWFETQDAIAYHNEFQKEKIVYPDIAPTLTFILDINKMFLNNTCYFLNLGIYNKYAISLLNSNLINWYFKGISAQLSEKAVRHFNIYVEKIPIPKIDSEKQKPFVMLTDAIIAKKERGEDTTTEENQIDQLVYKLYDLTPEEIKIIEGFNEGE
ncbi:MAG: TaqI-like C-terminal specificity domain-containing protein [Euryarchaeota archaeon]|nr:TaqI-like C-terminal specificity domain-containing protein [Euryarchaeota archaeon]